MSFEMSVDLTAFNRWKDKVQDRFENMGDILIQFCQNRVIPELSSEAGSQRRVRTGRYMGDWSVDQTDENSVTVSTDAFYWKFLEYGTSKGIEPKPIVHDVLERVLPELSEFILGALGLGS